MIGLISFDVGINEDERVLDWYSIIASINSSSFHLRDGAEGTQRDLVGLGVAGG